jgi:hypothetical protein
MSDFQPLAQSLAVALKALQMYTASHPRSQEALAAAHRVLDTWLADQPRLQFVVSGPKAFVDGQLQDTRSPHVTGLVKLISERSVSGFVFERGVTAEDLLVFLQGLATKPAKLEEQGGFEALLTSAGVQHIRVSQTRYQEVREGEESGSDDKAPAFSPAPPPPSSTPETLVKFIREALLASLAKRTPTAPGSAQGPGPEDGLGFLRGFQALDLSGLGPLGEELGLGEGMPTPGQLGTLRQVLLGLPPEVQFGLLAGLASLPDHPAGLALGIKALAGEVLSAATGAALARGTSWSAMKGPLQTILRPLPDREMLVRSLSAHLHGSGQDASQAHLLLRQLEWDDLSLEAKILKVMEAGHLFELSLDQRLALLRELLDLRRFDDFLRIQEILLESLRDDQPELRLKAAQTLAGIARWAHEPGLPPGGEGPLAEGLRAHFAWEADSQIHRWTTEAVESLLTAMVHRGDLSLVLADLQELENLCAFHDDQVPWRTSALGQLKTALCRAPLLNAVVEKAFALERDQMLQEVHPYLEYLGNPAAMYLVTRLGEEGDRTRRGRLVETVRSMGPAALPPLMEALGSPTWYLVRNALTLLSDLGDAGCVPAVVPLLRHPEPRVRRTAVRTIWKLGGPVAEPHLLARMKDTDAETMQEILFALGQLRSEVGLIQVAELAQDKRVLERLRLLALDTLGLIGSPKALPTLAECLKRKGFFGGGEPPTIRLAAGKALAALGTPEALALLQRTVNAEPKGEEREALRRLLDRPGLP